ncbi:hypothetical protein F3I76_10630 [Pseudomonas sp. MT4]|nr:hypothetical protein [Pseudomonas sp. MT4]
MQRRWDTNGARRGGTRRPRKQKTTPPASGGVEYIGTASCKLQANQASGWCRKPEALLLAACGLWLLISSPHDPSA